jgi:DNA-binding NarL/FixJ family response regulator
LNIRVAIFEDNKLVREAFEAILNGTEGFICTGIFSSCNNLKQDLQRSQPQVILMDIEMNGMNGIEASSAIARDHPEIKILIQTAFEDDDKVFRALCAGASGYVLKNTAPGKLLESITEVYNGGAPMSPTVAHKVLYLFQKFAPPANDRPSAEWYQLSKREKEILALMMEGNNLHVIAGKIFISYETVRTHVKSMYKKLHVASSNEAIIKAFRQKLI